MNQPAPASFDSLAELSDWVTHLETLPLDVDHLAVLLEMNGWNDRRANRLGFDSVFELAEHLFPRVADPYRQAALPEVKSESLTSRIWHGIRAYIRGIIFAVPVLLSSASVLLVGYSTWSYLYFSTDIATAIFLGMLGSFLVAGGFMQAIARRGLFFISQGYYRLARAVVSRMLLAGVAVAVLVAVAWLLLMVLVPVLPWSILSISYIYYLFLTATWLGVGLLYMLHAEILFVVFLAVTTALVLAFVHQGFSVIAAQSISMAVLAVLSVGGALILMQRLGRNEENVSRTDMLPRWSRTLRILAPYFLYGVVYFLLLFTDRVVAWSVPSVYHPLPIWFSGDYELSLDWAAFVLIVPMGFVDLYMDRLAERLEAYKRRTRIDQVDQQNQILYRRHLRQHLLILASGVVGILLVREVVTILVGSSILPLNPLANPVSDTVFLAASCSFVLIVSGLQNVVLLFSFNEPWPVVSVTLRAWMVDIAVGFLLSRYFGYHWAVGGLVAGAAAFAWLSTRQCRQVFTSLDQHLTRTI